MAAIEPIYSCEVVRDDGERCPNTANEVEVVGGRIVLVCGKHAYTDLEGRPFASDGYTADQLPERWHDKALAAARRRSASIQGERDAYRHATRRADRELDLTATLIEQLGK